MSCFADSVLQCVSNGILRLRLRCFIVPCFCVFYALLGACALRVSLRISALACVMVLRVICCAAALELRPRRLLSGTTHRRNVCTDRVCVLRVVCFLFRSFAIFAGLCFHNVLLFRV